MVRPRTPLHSSQKKGDRSLAVVVWSGGERVEKVSTLNGLATRVLLEINMVLMKSNLRMEAYIKFVRHENNNPNVGYILRKRALGLQGST